MRDKIKKSLPETDPETGKVRNPTQSPLVQIFREERDNLTKPATAQGAYAGTVKSVIQPIVHELGQAIESQSPEFAKAQQIYRDTSPAIDSAKWMQDLKLTDAGGRFTLAKVKNALDNAKKAKGGNSLNKAKSLDPSQIETLQNLHDNLARREEVMRASMPRGSNTAQNFMAQADMNTALGRANHLLGGKGPEMVGSAGGAMLGSAFGAPGAGAFLGDLGVRGLKNKSALRQAATTNKLETFMTDPQAYKEYLLNRSSDTFAHRLMGNLLKNP